MDDMLWLGNANERLMTDISPNINLLAWRAQQQSKQSRKFRYLIINSTLLAILCILLAHFLLSSQIRHLSVTQSQLEQQLNQQTLLHNEVIQIQKQTIQLNPRINQLTSLQNDRQQTIQLLTELSNITPAGVYLTNMSRQNQQITLVGKTVSSAQLAVLMQNISQSNILYQAKLNEMQFDKTNPPYQNDFVIISNTNNQPPISEGQ